MIADADQVRLESGRAGLDRAILLDGLILPNAGDGERLVGALDTNPGGVLLPAGDGDERDEVGREPEQRPVVGDLPVVPSHPPQRRLVAERGLVDHDHHLGLSGGRSALKRSPQELSHRRRLEHGPTIAPLDDPARQLGLLQLGVALRRLADDLGPARRRSDEPVEVGRHGRRGHDVGVDIAHEPPQGRAQAMKSTEGQVVGL